MEHEDVVLLVVVLNLFVYSLNEENGVSIMSDKEQEIKREEEEEEMEEDNDNDALDDDDEDEDDMEEEDQDEDDEDNDDASESKAFLPGSQPLEEGEELVMDDSAYVLYHQAHLGPPCLSFDLIDGEKNSSSDYPLTVFGVAGSQAAKASANSIIAFKMFNLHPIKHKEDKEDEEEESDEEDEEEGDPAKEPKLKVASIRHASGGINRIRCKTLGTTALAAAWGESGAVGIYGLNGCFQKLEQPMLPPGSNVNKKKGKGKNKDSNLDWHRETTPPIFEFKGHLSEGFAVAWSPTVPGALATGDCKRGIHLWRPSEGAASWAVDQRPLVGHADSVEDIQWSPNEENVLASW